MPSLRKSQKRTVAGSEAPITVIVREWWRDFARRLSNPAKLNPRRTLTMSSVWGSRLRIAQSLQMLTRITARTPANQHAGRTNADATMVHRVLISSSTMGPGNSIRRSINIQFLRQQVTARIRVAMAETRDCCCSISLISESSWSSALTAHLLRGTGSDQRPQAAVA